MSEVFVYVDDEAHLARVVSLNLGFAGLDVRGFSDPHEALEFLAETPVAAVLCDYRMPGMDGLAFLAAVEQDVPRFLVTGDLALRGELDNNPHLTDVIEKPFRYPPLIALLQEMLRRA